MANALVIRNADFSRCAIETVEFTNIPCTEIRLNKSQTTIPQLGGVEILSAVLSPLDTTDTVIWNSSDTNICTVENGVVTAVGIGSATITVRCGSAFASCNVTTDAYFDPAFEYGVQFYSNTTPQGDRYTNAAKLLSGVGCCSRNGNYKTRVTDGTTVTADCYPVKLPGNVKSIHVTAENCYIGISWSNTQYFEYMNYAVGLGGNTASSSSGIRDDVWYNVPDGADSFFLTIRNVDNTNMTAEVFSEIDWSVVYSTEIHNT